MTDTLLSCFQTSSLQTAALIVNSAVCGVIVVSDDTIPWSLVRGGRGWRRGNIARQPLIHPWGDRPAHPPSAVIFHYYPLDTIYTLMCNFFCQTFTVNKLLNVVFDKCHLCKLFPFGRVCKSVNVSM